MNHDEERFFEVEAYLRNEMTPEAEAAFRAKVAADPTLSKQVAEQRAMQKLEAFLIEDDLRANVKNWQANADLEDLPASPDPPQKKRGFPFWAFLAGLVLLVSLLWFGANRAKESTPSLPTNTQQPPERPVASDSDPAQEPGKAPQQPASERDDTPKKDKQGAGDNRYLAMAARYEELPTYAGGDIRGGDATTNAFEQAMASLDKREFGKAETLLRSVAANDEHWADAQYNLGCLLYQQKQYKKAIPLLTPAAENPDFLYADNARWYLALSLVATANATEANAQLAILVAQPKGDFYKKAVQLTTELGN